MEKKEEKTAEDIWQEAGIDIWANYDPIVLHIHILAAMNEFANQRYTPSEVLAIMEKVREACLCREYRQMQKLDLNKYLTK